MVRLVWYLYKFVPNYFFKLHITKFGVDVFLWQEFIFWLQDIFESVVHEVSVLSLQHHIQRLLEQVVL